MALATLMALIFVPSARSMVSPLGRTARARPGPQHRRASLAHRRIPGWKPVVRHLPELRAEGNQMDQAVASFLDIASFVSSQGQSQKSQYGELAEELGRNVYLDINGWKLYWRDITVVDNVKLNDFVASALGPKLKSLTQSDIDTFITRVPLKMGGGKTMLPLSSVTSENALRALYDTFDDAARGSW